MSEDNDDESSTLEGKKFNCLDFPELTHEQFKAAIALAYGGYSKGSGRRNGSIARAAKEAGVVRNTIYSWLENVPQLEECIESIKVDLRIRCLLNLERASNQLNVTASIYLLSCMYPREFDQNVIRQEIKHIQNKELLEFQRKLNFMEIPTATPNTSIVKGKK